MNPHLHRILLSITTMFWSLVVIFPIGYCTAFVLLPHQQQQSLTLLRKEDGTESSATYSSFSSTSSTSMRFKNHNNIDTDSDAGGVVVHSSNSSARKASVAFTPPSTFATGATSSSTSDAVNLKWSDFYTINDGDEDAAPVIFLHGLLGSKRNFATIGKALGAQLDKKRRILALDLRNHGENHHDWRDEMGYEEMASDVIAFMDNHRIEKAVIVGHSMGGKVAQALALLHSNRVDGLVVIDIAPVRYSADTAPQWKYVTEIIDVLNSTPLVKGETTRDDVDAYLRGKIPDPGIRSFCMTNVDIRNASWKINLKGITKEMDSIAGFLDANEETQREEQRYTGDAFFINGGQSKFIKHSYMETIAQYFPNHMLISIRGVGHWVHAEAPDDTIVLLKRYLDR